jgi:hypothetical protein
MRNGTSSVRCSTPTSPQPTSNCSRAPGAPSEKIPGWPRDGGILPACRSRICIGTAMNGFVAGVVKTTTATLAAGRSARATAKRALAGSTNSIRPSRHTTASKRSSRCTRRVDGSVPSCRLLCLRRSPSGLRRSGIPCRPGTPPGRAGPVACRRAPGNGASRLRRRRDESAVSATDRTTEPPLAYRQTLWAQSWQIIRGRRAAESDPSRSRTPASACPRSAPVKGSHHGGSMSSSTMSSPAGAALTHRGQSPCT